MLNKKIRNTALGVLIALFLLWGGLWLYYQIALEFIYFSSIGNMDQDTHQGIAMYKLQDDMEKYRSIHGRYPKIGENCQDILSLRPYFGEKVNKGEYKFQYNYQWYLGWLSPEENILLHPRAIWRFSVSVNSDGSAYVFRAEDRSDPFSGVMHFIARYIVWADRSNKKILSLKEIPMYSVPLKDIRVTGIVLGCDCTGKNFCVGNNNIVRFQSQ